MFQPTDFKGWGPNGLAWNERDLVLGDRKLIMEVNSIETGGYVGKDSRLNSDGFYLFARDPDTITCIDRDANTNEPKKYKNLNPITCLDTIDHTKVEDLMKTIKVCGSAWEGECCGKGFLWVADGNNKKILKLGPYNEILKILPYPGNLPNGLAFDGKYLWAGDSIDSKIYKISTDDGSVLSEFNSPLKVPTGLAWDCSNIWVLGMDDCKIASASCYTKRLVKIDNLSGKIIDEIKLPKHIERPTALEWVDGIFWVGDYYLNRIFKVSGQKAKGSSVGKETKTTSGESKTTAK